MDVVTTHSQVEISFNRTWWGFIASTRVFVENFCGQSFGPGKFSDRVALAVHELLENAVKYSATPGDQVHCSVKLDGEGVRVCVKNRGELAHVAVLQREFEHIRRGDPFEVYVAKMQESLTREDSQLGLARIRYECEAALSLTVVGDQVEIVAGFAAPQLKG